MSKEGKKTVVPRLRFPEFEKDGGWLERTIGDISPTVTAGGTPSTTESKYWGGEIRWMNSGELNLKKVHKVQGRITKLGLDNSSTKIIPPRCVLVGLAGQGKTRGTVAINLIELCTNQSIAAIYPDDSVFNSDFLYHNLEGRYDELRRLSTGDGGRGGLNLQIIKNLKIYLPQNQKEQQKIVDCLSSLDDLTTAQIDKVAALKNYKKGLLQQLFPQDGEAVPRLRFPEFRKDGGWSEKLLSEICDVNPASNGLPDSFVYIDLESVDSGRLLQKKTISKTNAPSRALRLLKFGDIIYQMVRPYQKNNFLFREKDGSTYVASTGYAQLRSNESSPYLFQYLHTDQFVDKVLKKCTGSSYPAINSTDLSNISVITPKRDEQQKIADCLSSLDDLTTAQIDKVAALKNYKKGLLQQLFPSLTGGADE